MRATRAVVTVAAFLAVVALPGQPMAVTASGRAAAAPPAHAGKLHPPRVVSFRAAMRVTPARAHHSPRARPFLSRRNPSSGVLHQARTAPVTFKPAGNASAPLQRSQATAAATSGQQTLAAFPAASMSADVNAFGSDQSLAPPDTQLAAGSGDLVEAVNDTMWVWSTTGTALAEADLNVFFAVPSGYSFTDPRAVYDAATGRWFVSGFASDSANDSIVYLAVSQTSDPTAGYYTYMVTSEAAVLTDQPKLGFDKDVIVLSWNDFTVPPPTFTGEETWILQKSDAISGAAPAETNFLPDTNRSSIVPAQSLTATSTEYATYNDSCGTATSGSCNTGSSALGLVAITGTPAGGNVTLSETDLPMNPTTVPPAADQPGAAASVLTDDDRFLNAVSDGTTLYVSANTGCIPSGDSADRPCALLVEVSLGTSPTVTVEGALGYNGGDVYYPAAAPDPNGGVFMAATFSSTSIYSRAVSLSLAPGASSFSGVTFQAGSGANTDGRWGDYSGVAVDPSNAADIWMAGEYAPSNGLDWGTAIAEVTAAPQLILAAPSSATVNTPFTVTVTVSDESGSTDTGYTGTVHFTSSDGAARLPADYTYTGADAGVHSFSITLQTVGGQTLTATDIANPTITGASPTIAVSPAVVDNQYGIYTLDGYGGLHPAGSAPPVSVSAYWPGWDIARGVASRSDTQSGYVLDGFGGIHPFGGAPPVSISAYWPGWDIARGITLRADGASGYVLDGWGGIHPFGGAPPLSSSAYWPGWDIARGIALDATGGGGWVLDGWGGIHPFGDAPYLAASAYWPGWDIARGFSLTASKDGGDVVDGYGGIHPFGSAQPASAGAYWPGWDIARGIVTWSVASSAQPGGWVVDGWGGLHPFGSAPPLATTAYWPHWDIARGLGGSPDGGGARRH